MLGKKMQLDVAIQFEGALLALFHRLDDLRLVSVGIERQCDVCDCTRDQHRRSAELSTVRT